LGLRSGQRIRRRVLAVALQGKSQGSDDSRTGLGEWMWRIVDHTDDKKRLVYGVLDNEPSNDYGKIALGAELAISYSRIRVSCHFVQEKFEHRKPNEFTKQRQQCDKFD
jgi:hypothetical protein